MSAVDGYDDLARLGWLKLSEDETSETCTEHDVPPTLEHCLTYAAVATDGIHFRSKLQGLITSNPPEQLSTIRCYM